MPPILPTLTLHPQRHRYWRPSRETNSSSVERIALEIPLGLLILKAGVERPHGEIGDEAVQLVSERIGPVAAFKTAVVIERLPKTRSGKILRGTMRRIADGEGYATAATIDDPGILGEITAALERIGYSRPISRA